MKVILKNNWLSPSGVLFYGAEHAQEVGSVDKKMLPTSCEIVAIKAPKPVVDEAPKPVVDEAPKPVVDEAPKGKKPKAQKAEDEDL